MKTFLKKFFVKIDEKVSLTALVLTICFLYTGFVHLCLNEAIEGKIKFTANELSELGFTVIKTGDYDKLLSSVSFLSTRVESVLKQMKVHTQAMTETKDEILASQKSFKDFNLASNLKSKGNVKELGGP